ncbi:hemerythrin domain-containing protein [Blastococcus sp. CT_GayMR19]|uniref:hemerythrin domain-containing protein n=1 Tax=Blastococcus sp. CT_GayMR19 TaxID=2559608 RepID=UPI001073B497|nr:hemerythrin domain-containing protein [Blastococcus sp. CT_GayMR19]TFV74462.1 hemerythrin domain-containing protein [Blastococcus sp. CT_GayMR19]
MTAAAVRSTALIPAPRPAGDDAPGSGTTPSLRDGTTCRAVAYQRVVHRLVRRELRLLADLAAWAPDDEAERTATLARHAELVGKVLLHHHRVERDAVWPALLRTVPDAALEDVRAELAECTARCARIDQMLRDVATAARQWGVAATPPARRAFATACRALADAVDAQTDDEENTLLPLLETHLEPEDWAAIAQSADCRLSAREQLLVLGLAMEDSSAADRARLLDGLSPATRSAWRLFGGRRYRAAVVRLRGAPPAR